MKKSLVLAMAMARLATGPMTASPSWQLRVSSRAMATTPSVATV